MALFLLKPVLWNSKNYQGPSGHKAAPESFPGTHGFGHEEWNNAPRLGFVEGGRKYRVFHTERVKKAAVDEHLGQTFVFMIASHDGVQQLVGIAGNAQYLGHPADLPERQRIAELLELDKLMDEAWASDFVRNKFGGKLATFKKDWALNRSMLNNWICPDEFFWWLDEPVTLNSEQITGKKKLSSRFSTYQSLGLREVESIMHSVPLESQGAAWRRLLDAMRISFAQPAFSEDPAELSDKSTTRLSLSQARVGQGAYRQGLLEKWGYACAASGLTNSSVLRASHVKPWRSSSNKERLDPENGLLLSANLDALFDVGLISFADDGQMLVSNSLGSDDRRLLGLPKTLRSPPSEKLKGYLKHHREVLFGSVRTE